MSDQESMIDKKPHTNTIRKVAFADTALKRLRSRLPGSRSLSRRDEHSISISDPQQSVEEQLVDDAYLDSKSGTCTESEVGSESRGPARGRVDRKREPRFSMSVAERQSSKNMNKPSKDETRAPEQDITLFAFRLVILETAARGLGKLTFVWATVLLNGFSSTVRTTDFWVVSGLLLTEGSRIFLLSEELAWQQAAGSRSSDERLERSAQRTWSASELRLLPCKHIVSVKGMATFLYIGQVISALVCLALSLWRLVLHDFLDRSADPSSHSNKTVVRSLYAFYVMAFLEAFVFLVEKTYWQYKITDQEVFETVDKKAGLKGECVETIESFFYKVYSQSLATTIFDGLEMDLVSFSMELLQSDDGKEVLDGSRILKTFVEGQNAFLGDTLRRIGIKPGAIDRLVEMLAWHHQDEQKVRLNSAAIVEALVSSTPNGSFVSSTPNGSLVSSTPNGYRVIAVSGSLENIMSLIQWDYGHSIPHPEESATSPPLTLCNYGLSILKSLARDHANRHRIGETRGLLAKLVDFIDINKEWIITKKEAAEKAETIRRQSLELLNMLASTEGISGSILRPAITNVLSAIPHLRDILHSPVPETSKELLELAMDVLTNLALDKTSREVIGSTGGVISNLMLLFTRRSLHQMPFQHRYSTDDDSSVKEAAVKQEVNLARKSGTVLMRLALQSKENCNRILRTRFSDPSLRACTVLLRILQHEENELGVHAAGILRGTFSYMSASVQAEVSRESEFLLNRAISCDSSQVREALLGLAIALRRLSDEEFISLFESQSVNRTQVVDRLLTCLSQAPSTNTRRYSLELIFILLSRDEAFKLLFADKDLKSTLVKMLDNISDVENYLLSYGGMGLTRHNDDMESLVIKVLEIFDADDR